MKKQLKMWHISDSHQFHHLLNVPQEPGLDTVIFTGDGSNHFDPYLNVREMENFLDWFEKLPFKNKIYVAGNHDTSIEKGLLTKSDFKNRGMIYLENDYTFINGFKIIGSPYTPFFGGQWAFTKSRNKMNNIWDKLLDSDNIDIVAVHGPPKSILDLSDASRKDVEQCGCKALYNHVLRLNPYACLFGHIHNRKWFNNAGVLKLSNYKTQFSNGSVVTDAKFGKVTSHGNLLTINP